MDPIGTLRDLRGLTQVFDLRSLAMASPGLIAAMVRQGLGAFPGGIKSDHPAGSAHATKFWDPESLDKFTTRFPARVKIRAGGREESVLVSTPRGGCGHPEFGPIQAADQKLSRWGPQLWGTKGTTALSRAVETDEPLIWKQLATNTGDRGEEQ